MRLSLYIHVPFCSTKCAYCDFYSIPVGSAEASVELKKRYIKAVKTELSQKLGMTANPHIETVFIGGGTPSVLGPELFSELLEGINSSISGITAADMEYTTEANIGTCSPEFLSAAEASGINRLSLGVQSFDMQTLDYLGRDAEISDIEARVREIRENWNRTLSLDIISGTGTDWLSDLKRAADINPEHLSVYQLTVEEGTPLASEISRGLKTAPDELNQSGAITEGIAFLESRGYKRYEISNFSTEGMECRHNLAYWNMQSYLGVGPSAVSSLYNQGDYRRLSTCRDLESYLVSMENNPQEGCSSTEILSEAEFMIEHFIMGCRLTAGIDDSVFIERFGAAPAEFIPETSKRWQSKGLMNPDLRSLNPEGLMFLDSFLYDVYDEIIKKLQKN